MVIAIIGSILLAYIAILYFLLAIGQPLGFLAWGGQYQGVLPKQLRLLSALSIPFQLFAAFILLVLAGSFPGLDYGFIPILGYVFTGFFFINSGLNLLSKSFFERHIMTPIALFIVFSYLYILFIY